jgi:outer membrane protein OmpA-like peptidoglycan-associated protein
MPATMNPVDWWHDMEGGPIAQARPPPPNADAPYPNLANVPAKPKADSQTLRAGVASGLLADRASGRYALTTEPLTPPPPAPAPAPAAAAAPGADSDGLGAKLQAASAPPPAPTPPASAAAPVAMAAAPDAGPVPEIPTHAPPPPVIPGVGIPAVTRPTPPPVPPPVAVPIVSAAGTAVAVPFASGSAVLTTAARTALRQLATKRGRAAIAVTGFGGAASSDPPQQSAALPLAWARAQTIAGTLEASGVPASMLRLTAEATGDGGVAVVTD